MLAEMNSACYYDGMNLNLIIKEAIAKGAAHTVRKPMASVRHDIAAIKKQMMVLRRTVRELQRTVGTRSVEVTAVAGETELKRKRRPTGSGIRKLRQKLGLTQAQFGKLLGVSSLSVSKWEGAKGPVSMRLRALIAIRKARGLGKREAQKAVQG